MTFRELIADWISGGALTRANSESDDYFNAWQDTEKKLMADARIDKTAIILERDTYRNALARIEYATRNGKSGTAIMINRMAREALK